MLWNPQVELVSQYSSHEVKNMENIALKSFSINDLEDFMEWATDDEVTQYMMWNSYTDFSQAEDFFHKVISNHGWYKAICLGDKVIGSITLEKGKGIHACKAELGYVLSREYWGCGFATLAVKLAIDQGFKDFDVDRIEAFVDPINVGSQKVLEKNNFIREGLLKKSVLQKGIVKDRYIYAIYKS